MKELASLSYNFLRRVGTLPSKFEMQHKTDIYFHLILLGFVAEEQEGRGDFDLKDKIC